MAGSKEAICNMALGHLGVLEQITTLATDRTKEAKACRLFYDQARQEVLGDFPWPFATVIADLTLDTEDFSDEWEYSYTYPATALRLLRPFSGIRPDTTSSLIPYRIISDGTAKLVLTNKDSASFEYVDDVEDTTQFPADFTEALALKLAAYIAPMVTGGDQFKLGLQCLNKYAIQMSIAMANAANQEVTAQPPESDFINARA